MQPITFYHGTTVENAETIRHDGILLSQPPWFNGICYVWMTLCSFQAEEYGKTKADILHENESNYAVVAFEFPMDLTEPDPEHFDKDTADEYASHRRTAHAIPPECITNITIYQDGKPVKELKEAMPNNKTTKL